MHGRDSNVLCNTLKVSAIFNDQSLDSNITLVINKLFLYEEKDPVIRHGNVKKSLEAVNKWNYRHLMKLPPGKNFTEAYFFSYLISFTLYPGHSGVGRWNLVLRHSFPIFHRILEALRLA